MEILKYDAGIHKVLCDNVGYRLPELSRDDPDMIELLRVIKKKKIQINRERKNTGVGRSMTLGICYKKWQGHCYAWCTGNEKYKELYECLLKVGKRISPVGFSAIQVNHNYPALPHKDANNVGHSVIFAIGDYTDGEFCLRPEEGDDIKLDVAYKPVLVNAAVNTHFVSEITSGDRWSFVFFTGKAIGGKKPSDVSVLFNPDVSRPSDE
jgi:hypothetical protein